MTKEYTDHEKRLFDWVTSKVETKDEMYQIAPSIAAILNRTDSAIYKQIEDRKVALGNKQFFWAKE